MKGERGPESMFEHIIAEDFPNLEKKTDTHPEGREDPSPNQQKWINCRHIIVTFANYRDKERILKTAYERGSQHTERGKPD